MKALFTLLICFLAAGWTAGQEQIDLSGPWGFRIDREDTGVKEQWYNRKADETINLPGSMPQKGRGDDISIHTQWTASLYDSSYYFNPRMAPYREKGHVKLPFFLTPDKHYVGVAWYSKEVNIPKNWKGKRIRLCLERPHTETTVWVDGRETGMQNSLCVPHVYDLSSLLGPGRHNISIRVDNRIKDINVGPDSHSVTDQTQGNWNGIVGKIALEAGTKTFFSNLQIYPDLAAKKATVKMSVESDRNTSATITLEAGSYNTHQASHHVPAVSRTVSLVKGDNTVEIDLPMGEGMLTWDEFSPALYRLTATLKAGNGEEIKNVSFGMREFTIKDKYFYVNGNKTMLRGTVENCTFPLTGYAPMDVEAWERVFRICRSYGLNHMRFHSYCPPEAAFIAADLVGFYLQPEGPSWPNHGSSLGNGRPIDNYLMEETKRLNKEYGNYASYCMMACGNEPRGRWVDWVTKFVDYWEKTDPRRVYTGASVGGSWQWQPRNQYHVKAGARGLDWGKRRPQSRDDFRQRIDTVRQPFVSHETGQWCAFPNFSEIRKYTGVNKAKNFEIFRDLLEEGGMGRLGNDFMMASGKLQALCYKYEIERTLRTPGYAGFQLLSLNDYSGQGTALVGLLDVFFEEKGYIDAPAFRRFCSATVPLARIDKFVYRNDETFKANIEVSHFGPQPIAQAQINYTVKNHLGALLAEGSFPATDLALGNCQGVGSVNFALQGITKPEKLNLEVKIDGTDFVNDWDFWVYPAQLELNAGKLHITDTLDSRAEEVLKNGGNVLLLAAGKISYGKEIRQSFTPVFWNTSWFKMRPPHTTGIFLNEYHPLFKDFPTEYHSNLQWWELVNNAQVMRLTDFPSDFQPLVQAIDTWFLSRKAGLLFEANVLNGKLLMTSMDLTSSPENRPVARQLYASVLGYMQSDAFRPADTIAPETIRELFTKVAPAIDFGTKGTPDELRPKPTDI